MFELIKPVEAASVNIGDSYEFSGVKTLGDAFSQLALPAFAIAAIAVTLYFAIGAFKYITSAGDKNAIAAARGMIVHAIIGFILLIGMFFILQMLPGLIGLGGFQLVR